MFSTHYTNLRANLREHTLHMNIIFSVTLTVCGLLARAPALAASGFLAVAAATRTFAAGLLARAALATARATFAASAGLLARACAAALGCASRLWGVSFNESWFGKFVSITTFLAQKSLYLRTTVWANPFQHFHAVFGGRDLGILNFNGLMTSHTMSFSFIHRHIVSVYNNISKNIYKNK